MSRPTTEKTSYWALYCDHGPTPATDSAVIVLPWMMGIDKIPTREASATVRFNVQRRLEIHVSGCPTVELMEDSIMTMTELMRALETVQPQYRWLQLTNGLPIGAGRRWWGRWIPITTLERDARTRLVRS